MNRITKKNVNDVCTLEEFELLTSFGVNLKNVDGNGHNNGGSHLCGLDDDVADDLTFGEAPVTRLPDADTIVELSGTIRSSSPAAD